VPEYPEIVFQGTDGGAVTDIAEYERQGGFSALRKARSMEPDDVIAELDASGLRGRGGAFFRPAASGLSSRSPSSCRSRTTSW
jgi:NADH:ubiquinone oxidoreductase subunit F (NADH-binding)